MVKNTDIGSEIMSDLKKTSFNKDYLIAVDLDDPLNFDKMEVVAKSHSYTDGYINFDDELKSENRVQVSLKGDSFLSYRELEQMLTERIKSQLARKEKFKDEIQDL